MRSESLGFGVFVGVAVLVASAGVGWFACSMAGGYFPDKMASAWQFALMGAGVGAWLGYCVAEDEEPPVLLMAGAAIAGYWWVGLQRIAEVFRTGPTTVAEAMGAQVHRFRIPGYVSPLDLWYVNLIVGAIAGLLIYLHFLQHSHR